ncbi:MAG TPA: excinuclease ABC subunit C [Xanthomonadaceae bacterium]|nr:excinuclease ABC subunit C [Xanthomonadaceae bacterium]
MSGGSARDRAPDDRSPADAGTPFDGKAYVRGLTTAPGVYRMYGADGGVLYIGKAASLRKRVGSYFTKLHGARIGAMVAQIARIEVVVTRTANEALLLENQLIKALKPRFNILMRDDKSYPCVLLTHEAWPRLAYHRGARARAGRYFGPYASATGVRETIDLMFKLFRLRSCEDSVFRNRTRPCLQHQIGRCSAPCVGLVAAADYADAVRRVGLFLEGRSNAVVDELGSAMEAASAALDFERAAALRDQIAAIRKVQARQYVDGDRADLDVIACVQQAGVAVVLVLSFREGMNLGTAAQPMRVDRDVSEGEILEAFVTQHYAERKPPREMVLSHAIDDAETLEAALAEQAGHAVEIKASVRGDRARYLEMALRNAQLTLATEQATRASQQARLDDLQQLLGLSAPPQRIECFDISHTMGEATVAANVVFGPEGAQTANYRRFNITGIEPGDDYAAMRQALLRRFKRGVEAGVLPDLLLIDGGMGQLRQALDVLDELAVQGVAVIGVAKGEARKAGDERLVFPDGRELRPGAASPGLQLVQQARDEAHRFAITGHRKRRAKARDTSRLEDIPGVGPRRRQALLTHFGGLKGLKEAGIEEIARADGVSAALAGRIYAFLHGLPDSEGAGGPVRC